MEICRIRGPTPKRRRRERSPSSVSLPWFSLGISLTLSGTQRLGTERKTVQKALFRGVYLYASREFCGHSDLHQDIYGKLSGRCLTCPIQRPLWKRRQRYALLLFH